MAIIQCQCDIGKVQNINGITLFSYEIKKQSLHNANVTILICLLVIILLKNQNVPTTKLWYFFSTSSSYTWRSYIQHKRVMVINDYDLHTYKLRIWHSHFTAHEWYVIATRWLWKPSSDESRKLAFNFIGNVVRCTAGVICKIYCYVVRTNLYLL